MLIIEIWCSGRQYVCILTTLTEVETFTVKPSNDSMIHLSTIPPHEPGDDNSCPDDNCHILTHLLEDDKAYPSTMDSLSRNALSEQASVQDRNPFDIVDSEADRRTYLISDKGEFV